MVLKTAKGTRDFGPKETEERQLIINKVRSVFQKHGGMEIDTPCFELKSLLTNKYGEDSKLIYDLEDQGGEKCSLRYDLTVPFARYLGMNKSIKSMRRYQIGKVFRRDQPSIAKGRMREFIQCDMDIVGGSESMVIDSEVCYILSKVLNQLGLNNHVIKLSHRKVLHGLLELSNISEELHQTTCSSIDKLDKLSWEDVAQELQAKGVKNNSVDILKNWMDINLPLEDGLRKFKEKLADVNVPESLSEGLKDLEDMKICLESMGVTNINMVTSLARGLDYYTGVIFEAVLGDDELGYKGGSIAGGGRYDNLVKTLSESSYTLPCIGFSVGIERIFAIVRENPGRFPQFTKKQRYIMVYIGTIGKVSITEKLKLATKFREAGIPALYNYKRKGSLNDLLMQAKADNIPYVVLLTPEDIEKNTIQIKNVFSDEAIPSTTVDKFISYIKS